MATPETLPQYAPRSAPQYSRSEHELGLMNNAGSYEKWTALKLFSRAASPKSLPVYIEGDTITGTLEVEASKLAKIREIKLSVSFEAGRPNIYY